MLLIPPVLRLQYTQTADATQASFVQLATQVSWVALDAADGSVRWDVGLPFGLPGATSIRYSTCATHATLAEYKNVRMRNDEHTKRSIIR